MRLLNATRPVASYWWAHEFTHHGHARVSHQWNCQCIDDYILCVTWIHCSGCTRDCLPWSLLRNHEGPNCWSLAGFPGAQLRSWWQLRTLWTRRAHPSQGRRVHWATKRRDSCVMRQGPSTTSHAAADVAHRVPAASKRSGNENHLLKWIGRFSQAHAN